LPLPGRCIVVVDIVEDDNLITPFQQGLDHVAPYETGTARHQYSLHRAPPSNLASRDSLVHQPPGEYSVRDLGLNRLHKSFFRGLCTLHQCDTLTYGTAALQRIGADQLCAANPYSNTRRFSSMTVMR